jgi:hypothetical protein
LPCRYVGDERGVRTLLDLASGNDVGVVFGPGSVARRPASLRAALAEVSVVTAARATDDDLSCLAPTMQVFPQDLLSLPRDEWLIAIQGQANRSRPLTVRLSKRRLDRMSDAEFAELRAEMRRRYTGTSPQLRRDPKYDLSWMATISPQTAEGAAS